MESVSFAAEQSVCLEPGKGPGPYQVVGRLSPAPDVGRNARGNL
jgi:hypothetical protein